ncbi:MAG: MinD/ParA family protein [Planctomycetia bacterium]|nr:MinD/ParA family protein [Planctomycetia bacterium]
MYDQAQILRGMMERRTETAVVETAALPRHARTIAITSGKGGVGKSNIALNLAIALKKIGHNVCLLDANLGLGNIDLLCGLNGYWNLSHVVSGARTVSEILLEGPCGIHVVPGASGLFDSADCSAIAQREILAQLEELERDHEYLIIDTGTGIHRTVRQFVSAAETVLIVTTPEPTAIADAYATLKALSSGSELLQPHILVNLADSPEQAREIIARVQQTARTFLHLTVSSAGHIPRDPAVPAAVARRKPFVADGSRCAAGMAVEQLARRIVNLSQPQSDRSSYFSQFARFLDQKAA